jgi:hypothetical protein
MRNSIRILLLILGISGFASIGAAQSYKLTNAEMSPYHMKALPIAGAMKVDNKLVQIAIMANNPADNLNVQLPFIRTQTARCDVVYTLARKDMTASTGRMDQIEVWFFRNSYDCFSDQKGSARVFYTTILNPGTTSEHKYTSKMMFRLVAKPEVVVRCVQQNYQADHALTLEIRKDAQGNYYLVEDYDLFVGESVTTHNVTYIPPTPGRVGGPVTFKGNAVNLSINWTTSPTKDGSHALYLGTDGDRQELWCKAL